jgi:hypothetical protein
MAEPSEDLRKRRSAEALSLAESYGGFPVEGGAVFFVGKGRFSGKSDIRVQKNLRCISVVSVVIK